LPSTVAHADPFLSLGVEGGIMAVDSSSPRSDAGGAFGLRGGVGFLGPTRLELRYLRGSLDASGHSIRSSELAGQLRLTVPTPVVKPYLFAGVGRRSIQLGDAPSDDAWVSPLGAGIDLPIALGLVAAPEFTWHHRLSGASSQPFASYDSWNASLVLRLDL
jgi:hypothetical protein